MVSPFVKLQGSNLKNEILDRYFCRIFIRIKWNEIKLYKKTLYVVTIAIICSTSPSPWKFQYSGRPVYNPVEHLWWSFYCKNSKPLSIFTKKLHHVCLGSKYGSTFLKIFNILHKILEICYFFEVLYFF